MANNSDQNNSRVAKTNELVDKEARALLKDIESATNDIDCIIDIVKDRVIKSDDIGHTIALSRLMEIKTDLFKKRTDVLKALVSDKSIDLNAVKRASSQDFTSLESILGGMAIGAGAIAMSNNNRVNPNLPYIDTSAIEVVNTAEIVTEIESVDLTPKETKEQDLTDGVEDILNGN